MSSENQLQKYIDRLRVLMMLVVTFTISLFSVIVLWVGGIINLESPRTQIAANQVKTEAPGWHPPELSSVKDENKRNSIEYGRDLIAHTSIYLGPQGTVKRISNFFVFSIKLLGHKHVVSTERYVHIIDAMKPD